MDIKFKSVCHIVGIVVVIGITVTNVLSLVIAGNDALMQFRENWHGIVAGYSSGVYLLYVGRKQNLTDEADETDETDEEKREQSEIK